METGHYVKCVGLTPIAYIFKIYGPILRDAKRCKFPAA